MPASPTTSLPYKTALIIGAGPGISASLARLLAAEGVRVVLAARDIDKLAPLLAETGAAAVEVDAADPASMHALFDRVRSDHCAPEVVVYNASLRAHGPIADLDPEAVRKALEVSAFGAFLAVREAARHMVPAGHGAILLTGASASVKGFARSAAFAMGKFAMRGLAQSAARELHPSGVHVAHFVIDGAGRGEKRPDFPDRPDSTLTPEGIARAYLDVLRQPRDAWSHEVELRPWTETF